MEKVYSISISQEHINSQFTMFPMCVCGFIAQLVEHRSRKAEVMGSKPTETGIFYLRFFAKLQGL